jgi:ATP/ADP translocase
VTLWSVRPGERAVTAALSGYFFLLMASLYVMKPARNSLFIQGLGADNLPWVYIATAFVTWWVVAAYVRAATVTNLQRIIGATLAVTLACLIAFWLWLPRSVEVGPLVFYVWVKVYAVLLPSQFWLLSEELLDPRQARRLFGPIGTGGVLGGICGSALAVSIAATLGTGPLLLCAVAVVIGAAALFHFVLAGMPLRRVHARVKATASEPSPDADRDGQGAPPHTRELMFTIAAILVLSTAAHTVVDWQFNKAAESIASPDARAAFFGGFFAVLNLVTLVIQMLGTSFILSYFGVGVAIALLPAALATGAVGILLHPGLTTISMARGADDALRLSVDQSGRELLFLPFSSTERRQIKPRIDLIASRLANGSAGALILLAIWWLPEPIRPLSAVVLALVALWALLVVRARRQYANALQHLLRVRDLDISSLARSRLEANASSAIREGLTSGDRDTIRAALELAEHTEPGAFVEEVRELLRDTADEELHALALQLLAEADDESTISDALESLDHADGTSIAEALAYACTTRDAEARERIFHVLDRADTPLDREVVRSTLGTLLRDERPHVVRGALAACARFPDAELISAICDAGGSRSVEGAALQTLQACGQMAIGVLTGLLANPRSSRSLRCFAARALGRVGGKGGAAGLIAGLVADDRAVRRATLKSLNYMRRRGEDLALGRERESAAIAIEWQDYLALQRIAAALGPSGTDGPTAFVATVVGERLWEAEEQLFRALALRHPIQAVFFAYRGLITGDPAARSHAIELVDSIIETPERRTLVRLLETADPVERGRIAAAELGLPLLSRDAALHELLDPGDPWLAACAIRALTSDSDALPQGLRQELRAHDYAPLNELL